MMNYKTLVLGAAILAEACWSLNVEAGDEPDALCCDLYRQENFTNKFDTLCLRQSWSGATAPSAKGIRGTVNSFKCGTDVGATFCPKMYT